MNPENENPTQPLPPTPPQPPAPRERQAGEHAAAPFPQQPAQPAQPAAVQPVQPAPVQPAQPAAVQPVQPAPVQPAQPVASQPTAQPGVAAQYQAPVSAAPVVPGASFGSAFGMIFSVFGDLWKGQPGQAFERVRINKFFPWIVSVAMSLSLAIWFTAMGSQATSMIRQAGSFTRDLGINAGVIEDEAIGRVIFFLISAWIVFAIFTVAALVIRAAFMKATLSVRGVRDVMLMEMFSRLAVAYVPMIVITVPVNLLAALIGTSAVALGFLLLPIFLALWVFTEVLLYLATVSARPTEKSALLPYFSFWALFTYISGILIIMAIYIVSQLQ